ncbi:hypothetical protein D3C73_743370 [compost metagenome]
MVSLQGDEAKYNGQPSRCICPHRRWLQREDAAGLYGTSGILSLLYSGSQSELEEKNRRASRLHRSTAGGFVVLGGDRGFHPGRQTALHGQQRHQLCAQSGFWLQRRIAFNG